ncbi:MAG: VWA domain-containing protein, partial [Verrucomicrobiota bacterium]
EDFKGNGFTFKRAGMKDQAHQLMNADEANEFYQKLSKTTGNSAILTYAGRPAALIAAIDLQRKTELITTLTQTVGEKDRFRTYTCPMPATEFAAKPVERVTVSVNLASSDHPIHSLFCTTLEVETERLGPRSARVTSSVEKYDGQDDLKLHYVIDKDPLGVRVITHRAKGETDGYFMLLAHPAGIEESVEKDIVFALDVSGSMRGEKMEQARSAIEYCLGELNDGDRFNIIAFGTEVQSFRPDAVKKSTKNLKAAQNFIDELVAVGRTNIGDALKKGLAGESKKGRLRILVFLTDGTPTSGELIPDNILKQLPEMNTSKAGIYVVGVGHDVNAHLLDQIAELTDGQSEYAEPDEEIDEKVAALYNRLSHPVLTDVKMDFADINTHAVYPPPGRS